jgi:hypothetical protein
MVMSPVGLGNKNDFAARTSSNLPLKEGQNRRCNKISAYTERLAPPLVEEEAPLLSTVHVQERAEILFMDLDET